MRANAELAMVDMVKFVAGAFVEWGGRQYNSEMGACATLARHANLANDGKGGWHRYDVPFDS